MRPNPHWWAVKTEAFSSAACKKVSPAICTLASSCSPLWQPPWLFSATVSDYFSYEISSLVLEAPTIQPHPPHSCCSMLPELPLQTYVPTGLCIPSKFSLYPSREARQEYITTAIFTVQWLFGVWTDCNILKRP